MASEPGPPMQKPLVAWLGPAPERPVVQALDRLVRLHVGWSPEAQLVVVWAGAGSEGLLELPPGASRLPVVAVQENEPETFESLRWIEAGADNLVSVAGLADLVARRLRVGSSVAVQRVVRGDLTRKFVEVGPGVEDAFPPLSVVPAPADRLVGVNAYVENLQRYLGTRDKWVARYGPESLSALLELYHLRDQVPVTADGRNRINTFGNSTAVGGGSLDWPVMVRRALSRGGRKVEISEATVVSVGTDGLLLDVGFRSTPRQRIVVDVAISERNNAQFLIEARMQRRVTSDRWFIGGVVVALRKLSLPRR